MDGDSGASSFIRCGPSFEDDLFQAVRRQLDFPELRLSLKTSKLPGMARANSPVFPFLSVMVSNGGLLSAEGFTPICLMVSNLMLTVAVPRLTGTCLSSWGTKAVSLTLIFPIEEKILHLGIDSMCISNDRGETFLGFALSPCRTA